MNNNSNSDDVINAIGSLGEISGVLFQSLTDNGFASDQALFLVKEFIIATLEKSSNG